jgi:uncharacterized protein
MQSYRTRDQILAKLSQLKPVLHQRYKLRSMALFGSAARDERRADSDIDILAEFDETADLLDFVGAAELLEDELQTHVDLVPRRALRQELLSPVMKEAVSV